MITFFGVIDSVRISLAFFKHIIFVVYDVFLLPIVPLIIFSGITIINVFDAIAGVFRLPINVIVAVAL